MIEAFFANPYTVIGSILLLCFGGYVQWRNNYKTRRANACATFRASILSALSGIYPPTTRWGENISSSLIATLPAVKSACVAFEPYINRFRRKAFAKAYETYEEHCHQEQPFAFLLAHALDPVDFPDNPQTIFSAHVRHLLSFANET